ncbi:MAG: pentapeptide repeat-containing protein [Candidatus Magasanikbacteria bacterium]
MHSARIVATSFRQVWTPSPMFFEEAYLRSVSFWGADATGLVVRKANMKEVDMRWSDLSWMQAQGLEMERINLDYAILRGSVFDKAVLTDVSMRCCDMSKASFHGAHLRDVSFSCSEKLGGRLARPAPVENRIVRELFVRPSLRGTSFRGAVLESPDFQGTDLTDTDFRDATLRMPLFRGAHFYRTDFSGATVEGVTTVTPIQRAGAICYSDREDLSRRLKRTRLGMKVPRSRSGP